MQNKGILFVLSAPSGCGKTSVLAELLKDSKAPARCITYTTRSMRSGEKNGVDYHFVSVEEFGKKKESGFFLEWASVYENFYGTARSDVETLLNKGRDVIVSVDVQGAKTIRSQMDAILIFLTPPSWEELEDRLRNRGTETPEELERRLKEAKTEMAHHELFDFTVTNDTVKHSAENMMSLIEIERSKRSK